MNFKAINNNGILYTLEGIGNTGADLQNQGGQSIDLLKHGLLPPAINIQIKTIPGQGGNSPGVSKNFSLLYGFTNESVSAGNVQYYCVPVLTTKQAVMEDATDATGTRYTNTGRIPVLGRYLVTMWAMDQVDAADCMNVEVTAIPIP